jgi:hypothetical protein
MLFNDYDLLDVYVPFASVGAGTDSLEFNGFSLLIMPWQLFEANPGAKQHYCGHGQE